MKLAIKSLFFLLIFGFFVRSDDVFAQSIFSDPTNKLGCYDKISGYSTIDQNCSFVAGSTGLYMQRAFVFRGMGNLAYWMTMAYGNYSYQWSEPSCNLAADFVNCEVLVSAGVPKAVTLTIVDYSGTYVWTSTARYIISGPGGGPGGGGPTE